MKIKKIGVGDAYSMLGPETSDLVGKEISPQVVDDGDGEPEPALQAWTEADSNVFACPHLGAYHGGALVDGEEYIFHEIYVEE